MDMILLRIGNVLVIRHITGFLVLLVVIMFTLVMVKFMDIIMVVPILVVVVHIFIMIVLLREEKISAFSLKKIQKQIHSMSKIMVYYLVVI